jgi:DNA (cytosine-5)-methyltransferase 1
MIKVGSDFSGVGAFNQALMRLGVEYKEVFACDMDKYARQTFIHNYGEPEYYPENVYKREIPKDSLDIYMTSPPCQAFSLAGKRLGKDDKRGILFFNSLEFIQVNKPRYFLFENVKGLLSDDNGKTFSEWVNLLGGRSVNGLPVLFPYDDSVPYHLYWKVLNAKEHGVPQNRERVFLIGIRDDSDNSFRFPIEEHLTKRLKDMLEEDVDDKYFISDKKIEYLLRTEGTTFDINSNILKQDLPNESRKIQSGYFKGGRDTQFVKIKSNTLKGYEEAIEGDSINFSVPNSETRRGRVGKGVAQTLDTGCNQGIISYTRDSKGKVISRHINQQANTIHSATGGGGNTDQFYIDGFRIRRLTPRECFRLMDFSDTFTWDVSDSQAYKQAGNSIVVNVLYKILKNLNL